MNGRFLLDSNIVIALFSGEQSVLDKIQESAELYLPAIVIGELYYGAFNSSRQQTNLDRIDQFKSQISILDCDEYTAKYYGQIKKGLKNKGTPIPENDIWIAALALQYDLTIVMRDAHFNQIENLKPETW